MSATTESLALVCGQSSPNADNLRTCPGCQNDLVCHDLGECRRPTPETDAEELHNFDLVRELPFCVVRIDFVRRLERERDEARADLAAMREAIKGVHACLEEYSTSSRAAGRIPMCPKCACVPTWGENHQNDCSVGNLLAKLQPFTAAAAPARTEGGAA